EPPDDVDGAQTQQEIGRLEADVAAEAGFAAELLVDVGLRHAVEPDDVERVDLLGDAGERPLPSICLYTLEQTPPRVVVVHEVGRAAAVSDRVDRDDTAHALVVGGGGNRDAAAERPADEGDRVRVDLGNRLEEADACPHVLALLLRDEPAARALALPEAAVVER